MKKLLLGVLMLGGLALANEPVDGQTFQNGSYYANPSWDQQIPAAQRFIVLSNWNNEAVLDRETGLVWQRSPHSGGDWVSIQGLCLPALIGGRYGWRLPSTAELASLLDPTQSNPSLPAGNPFQNILFGSGSYWTSNASQGLPDFAWIVYFGTPPANSPPISIAQTMTGANALCVRGGFSDSNPH
jgi:hypothetical protein